jgi:hypothetical protein
MGKVVILLTQRFAAVSERPSRDRFTQLFSQVQTFRLAHANAPVSLLIGTRAPNNCFEFFNEMRWLRVLIALALSIKF